MLHFDESSDLRLANGDSFRIFQSTIFPPNSQLNEDDPFLPLLFILHHGGGHTAQTWATTVSRLKQRLSDPANPHPLKTNLHILAYDCRGHGKTRTGNDGDLSLATLAEDLDRIISEYTKTTLRTQRQLEIVLVGHSMGGAVVVEYARRYNNPSLLGLCMIDVVEGTAVEALAHMRGYLNSRPAQFSTEQEAVQWAVRSAQVRNEESAAISIPAQLIAGPEGMLRWRTDLLQSEPFWQGWFADLSEKFLQVRAAKLLMVAGTDRLDKPLTIGQIQGKFQMIVMPHCGHCIQEDDPLQTANGLWEFYYRNSRNNLPLVLRKKLAAQAER